jgi:uncharacterized protein YcaQ
LSAAPAASLTWPQALAWRVRRHGLDERVPAGREFDVASRLCGLHAQVMSSAELTLWARVDGLKRDAVSRALWEQRALVKTWAMRGTLHLLRADEYPVWQAALGTYRHYLKPSWLKGFGTDEEGLERLVDAVSEALEDQMLTREELARAVAESSGSDDLGAKLADSWGAFLKPASFRGGLCFAPDKGRNVRFTHPATWIGSWEPVDPDEANAEVLRRYLAVHGPARREDFARWWAISPAQAGKRIAALGDEVAPVDVEGTSAWMLAADVAGARAAKPGRVVNLLPAFDQWVIGASRDEPALIAGDNKARVYRQQGWISPVLLVNGRMDGVWRHERKGDRLLVSIEPFVKLPAWARKEAEAEAERLATFFGGALELTWGTV